MDGSRFDAWTRRRFSLVAGGGLAALLTLSAWTRNASEAKKRKKRLSKKRRCRQKANRTWCDGTCLRGACCPDAACGPDCLCARTIDGTTACMNAKALVECVGGCASNADCGDGGACRPLSQPCGGGITALCFPRCPTQM